MIARFTKYQSALIESALASKVIKYMKQISKITDETEYRRQFFYSKLLAVLDTMSELNKSYPISNRAKDLVNSAYKLMSDKPAIKYTKEGKSSPRSQINESERAISPEQD